MAFTPAELTGLVVWTHIGGGKTLVSGRVSQWDDMSGSAQLDAGTAAGAGSDLLASVTVTLEVASVVVAGNDVVALLTAPLEGPAPAAGAGSDLLAPATVTLEVTTATGAGSDLGYPHDLAASNLALQAPVLAQSTLGQTQALTASSMAVAAVLDEPSLSTSATLAAADLVLAAPVIGAPTAGQTHDLAAAGLTLAASVLDQPIVGQDHALNASSMALAAAAFSQSALAQTQSLIAAALNARVVFSAPVVLSNAHIIHPDDLVLPSIAVGQLVHEILYDDLGQPLLDDLGNPLYSSTTLAGLPDLVQTHGLSPIWVDIPEVIFGQPIVHMIRRLGSMSFVDSERTAATFQNLNVDELSIADIGGEAA